MVTIAHIAENIYIRQNKNCDSSFNIKQFVTKFCTHMCIGKRNTRPKFQGNDCKGCKVVSSGTMSGKKIVIT